MYQQRNYQIPNNNIFFYKGSICIVFILFVLLFLPTHIYSNNIYYYLQVGSFKIEQNALQLEKNLNKLNQQTVIRRVEISNKGLWFIVYVGPFSYWEEADKKRLELRKKGLFFEEGIIKKKMELIISNLNEKTDVQMETLTRPKKEEKISPPKDTGPPVERDSVEADTRLTKIESLPSQKQDVKQLKPIKESSTTTETKLKQTSEAFKKPDNKGFGRNIGKSRFELNLKHTFIEYQTELTKRVQSVSDGSATKSNELTLDGLDKYNLKASLNMDTLRIRYGLTDYLEFFADIGAVYEEFSNAKLVYGGGARLNLFHLRAYGASEFYSAFEGEYLGGEIEREYISTSGHKWSQESDWHAFTTRLEFGIVLSKLTIYAGGVYFIYREDAKRHLLENIPSPYTSFIYEDELSEQYNLGAFGGIDYSFSPALSINIQGQIINQKSIFGSLEYQF